MALLSKAETTKAFASSQTCINWKIANTLTAIKNDEELSSQATVFSLGYDGSEIETDFGSYDRLLVLNNDLITEEEVSPVDYEFTGVEFESVILILGTKTLSIDDVVESSCLQLLYNVMTRSINTFTLFTCESYEQIFKCLTEMKTQRQKFNYAMALRNSEKLPVLLHGEMLSFSDEEFDLLTTTNLAKKLIKNVRQLIKEEKQGDRTTLAKSILKAIASQETDSTVETLLVWYFIYLAAESDNWNIWTSSLDSIRDFLNNFDDQKLMKDKNVQMYLLQASSELLIEIVQKAKTYLSRDEFFTFMTKENGLLENFCYMIETQEASKVLTYVLCLDVVAELLSLEFISRMIGLCCLHAYNNGIADQLLSSLPEDQRYLCLLAVKTYFHNGIRTAMHYACLNGHGPHMCKWVHEMDKKYALNGQPTLFQDNTPGYTPLLTCHIFSRTEFVKFFENELNCDPFKDTCYLELIQSDAVYLFKGYNWEMRSYMLTKIHNCYQKGEEDRVPVQLKHKFYNFLKEVWEAQNAYKRSQHR